MFKWAKQPGRKFVTVNPFADLPAPGGTIAPRDRFLSADEIRQVWRALDDPASLRIKPDAATALRLILVTAARPGMVRGMVGSELRDLRGPSVHGPHWSLPAERMKAGSAFITPLSPLALELLRPHLKTDPAAPLFDLPRYYLHHAAKLIVARLGMARWTPHDLRRTAATILDREGYSLEQIGALLAHTRKGVTAVYARWDKFDLRREMAMVIERSLRETLDGEPSGGDQGRRIDGNRRNSTTRGRPLRRPFFWPPSPYVPVSRCDQPEMDVAPVPGGKREPLSEGGSGGIGVADDRIIITGRSKQQLPFRLGRIYQGMGRLVVTISSGWLGGRTQRTMRHGLRPPLQP